MLKIGYETERDLRVARPTDHFEDVIRFYRDGLGMTVIGSFAEHDGFYGVMLGVPGEPYHLEFTRCADTSRGDPPAPPRYPSGSSKEG